MTSQFSMEKRPAGWLRGFQTLCLATAEGAGVSLGSGGGVGAFCGSWGRCARVVVVYQYAPCVRRRGGQR